MSIMITVVRQVLFLVPFLFILPKFMGIDGIWASFSASDFMAFVFSLYILLREMRLLNFTIERNYRTLGKKS